MKQEDLAKLPQVTDPTSGLSKEQQQNLLSSFGTEFLEKLNSNVDNRMTNELATGFFHTTIKLLNDISKSLIVDAASKENQTDLIPDDLSDIIDTEPQLNDKGENDDERTDRPIEEESEPAE